jgi:DNA-binding MltR family transcriptional regulator
MTSEQPEVSPTIKNIDWEELKKSFDQIKVLSERGGAIISVSHLDEQLTSLLKAFFVNDPKAADQMLEDPGPLSSFWARIELAFLLGLISSRERRMLNLMRKIRNDFAHGSAPVSFSQSPVKERCLELDAKVLESLESKVQDYPNPEKKFFAAFSFMLIVLVHRREQLTRREEAESISEESIDSVIKEHPGKSE